MKIPRLYSGDDGESHFGELDIPLEDMGGGVGVISKLQAATGMFFRNTGSDYDLDWHTAPRRQYIIILEGAVEIETGDGTRRRFGPGDVFLAEDLTGRGHISRAVDNQPRRSIFIPID